MTRSSPCVSFSLRHFERSSDAVIPEVSSMTRFVLPTRRTLSTSLDQSSSSSSPVRIFCESTREFMDKIRLTSCCLLISRLNIAIVLLLCIEMYSTKFNTNAVLPIAGRAAIRIRSDFCKPAVL